MNSRTAGPEFDALIATQVMGWRSVQWAGFNSWELTGRVMIRVASWQPTINLLQSFQALELFKGVDIMQLPSGRWRCQLPLRDGLAVYSVADTLPLAICRTLQEATS